MRNKKGTLIDRSLLLLLENGERQFAKAVENQRHLGREWRLPSGKYWIKSNDATPLQHTRTCVAAVHHEHALTASDPTPKASSKSAKKWPRS